jgi:hypothetical protein
MTIIIINIIKANSILQTARSLKRELQKETRQMKNFIAENTK